MRKKQTKELVPVKEDEKTKAALGVKEDKAEMSLYEYERKYVRQENTTRARFFLFVCASFVGIILITCLTLLVLKFFDIHWIAGCVAAGVALLLFILCFIVPLVKILRSDYFVTNVDERNARQAQAHNRALRRKLGEKMIEFSSSVDGIGWCKDKTCQELALALKKDDNAKIKSSLTKLYQGPVKTDAKNIIRRKGLKCGIYTAISQDGKADATIVALMNFQLVRDLVYLYGFRPSDAKLARIFGSILESVLISYGIGKIEVGEKILSSFSKVPFVSAFSTLIDSGVQGAANGLLTLRIGYETIAYLNKEYHLQAILDGVSVDVDLAEQQSEETALQQEYDAEKKNIKAIKA